MTTIYHYLRSMLMFDYLIATLFTLAAVLKLALGFQESGVGEGPLAWGRLARPAPALHRTEAAGYVGVGGVHSADDGLGVGMARLGMLALEGIHIPQHRADLQAALVTLLFKPVPDDTAVGREEK